jgi:hypothetical protein
MKYMHDLNFFQEPLRKDFIMPDDSTAINFDHANTPLFWTYIDKHAQDIVNTEILDWLDQNNLKMHTVNIFKTPPNFTAGIHIDGDVNYLKPTVNWVLSGYNSEQIYYKPVTGLSIDNCLIESTEHDSTRDFYRPFDETKLTEIERKKIVGPTLIRINVPHRVANYDNESRFTVSLRFDSKSNDFFTWVDILKLFKDYIK